MLITHKTAICKYTYEFLSANVLVKHQSALKQGGLRQFQFAYIRLNNSGQNADESAGTSHMQDNFNREKEQTSRLSWRWCRERGELYGNFKFFRLDFIGIDMGMWLFLDSSGIRPFCFFLHIYWSLHIVDSRRLKGSSKNISKIKNHNNGYRGNKGLDRLTNRKWGRLFPLPYIVDIMDFPWNYSFIGIHLFALEMLITTAHCLAFFCPFQTIRVASTCSQLLCNAFTQSFYIYLCFTIKVN